MRCFLCVIVYHHYFWLMIVTMLKRHHHQLFRVLRVIVDNFLKTRVFCCYFYWWLAVKRFPTYNYDILWHRFSAGALETTRIKREPHLLTINAINTSTTKHQSGESQMIKKSIQDRQWLGCCWIRATRPILDRVYIRIRRWRANTRKYAETKQHGEKTSI